MLICPSITRRSEHRLNDGNPAPGHTLYFTALIGSFPSSWDLLLTCFSDPYLQLHQKESLLSWGNVSLRNKRTFALKQSLAESMGLINCIMGKFPVRCAGSRGTATCMQEGGSLFIQRQFLLKRKTR